MLRHLLISVTVASLAAPSLAVGETTERTGPAYRMGEVVIVPKHGPPTVVDVGSNQAVRQTVQALRRHPDLVQSVGPNPIARIAANPPSPSIPLVGGASPAGPQAGGAQTGAPTEYTPNDPGAGAGWQPMQWNFTGPFSVNATRAWANARAAGAPGGRGVTIAVLDSGVAYRTAGRYRRSPDFGAADFVAGYDFIDDDAHPDDENGHGTHVASTIGEATNNAFGLTGLAYGARIMPIRVLDRAGEGDVLAIARGVRFATRRGVAIINLSLEFSPEIRASEVPALLDAIKDAKRAGVLVVGAAGNEGIRGVSLPARHPSVVAVGATTERGCLSEFSNEGPEVDLVAPGGGQDADGTGGLPCDPTLVGRPVYQLTLLGGSTREFGLPGSYEGTSMATPHVSATAALVIASKLLGPKPTPTQLEEHLERTARDLGPSGRDGKYGSGLLDAAAATATATLTAK